MFSLSRLSMLIVAFFLGFAVALGATVGVAAFAVNSLTINKIEDMAKIDLQTEKVIGDNPEVDLRDMSLFSLIDEFKDLKALEETVTINLLKDRYDVIIPAIIDNLLSDESRDMPITYLMTDKGKDEFFSTLYVGQIQGFECLKEDGTPGKPSEENTYWYRVNSEDPSNKEKITGLNEMLADFTLGDILAGSVNSNSLLEGIQLSDVLGYTFDEENNYWLDKNGVKVTGVMAVFAGETILTVDEKLNTVLIGDLLGYTYNEGESIWYEGEVAVHGFMNVVAGRTLENVGSIMDELTIGDIIPERNGIMAIIPEDTKFNDIGTTINDSISASPLQFFMNQGLVSFDDKAETLDDLAKTLYDYNPTTNANMITTFTACSKGDAGYDEFQQNFDYYHNIWTDNGDGTYSVATWRTKPLSESFSIIIGMFTAQSQMLPPLPI